MCWCLKSLLPDSSQHFGHISDPPSFRWPQGRARAHLSRFMVGLKKKMIHLYCRQKMDREKSDNTFLRFALTCFLKIPRSKWHHKIWDWPFNQYMQVIFQHIGQHHPTIDLIANIMPSGTQGRRAWVRGSRSRLWGDSGPAGTTPWWPPASARRASTSVKWTSSSATTSPSRPSGSSRGWAGPVGRGLAGSSSWSPR